MATIDVKKTNLYCSTKCAVEQILRERQDDIVDAIMALFEDYIVDKLTTVTLVSKVMETSAKPIIIENKDQFIKMACDWLLDNAKRYYKSEYNEFHQCVEYDGTYYTDNLVTDFKKYMEGKLNWYV